MCFRDRREDVSPPSIIGRVCVFLRAASRVTALPPLLLVVDLRRVSDLSPYMTPLLVNRSDGPALAEPPCANIHSREVRPHCLRVPPPHRCQVRIGWSALRLLWQPPGRRRIGLPTSGIETAVRFQPVSALSLCPRSSAQRLRRVLTIFICADETTDLMTFGISPRRFP